MTDASLAIVPWLTTPPDFEFARISVWLVEPTGLMTFAHPGAVVDEDVAKGLEMVRDVLAPRLKPGSRLTILHDWRQVARYTAEGRHRLTEFSAQHRDELGAAIIVMPVKLSSLLQMGVEVACMVLRPIGIDIWPVKTLDDGLRKYPGLVHRPLTAAERDAHRRA